jgi:hypothetical protein
MMAPSTSANGRISGAGRPDLAVYYWPNFHPDRFHQSKKGEGWTEWQVVRNAAPRFEGHQQPLEPLWGYRDESDPVEMGRSIDAMCDAGIDAVIFDWCRYDDDIDGGALVEGALRNGFLRAPNRNRIAFALMWANHDYLDIHPIDPKGSYEAADLWRSALISPEGFVRHTQDAIDCYFSQPNYWRIKGAPYFSIYDVAKLCEGLGGLDPVRSAFDDFRARTKAAGFPDLHLNVIDWTLDAAADAQRGQSVEALGGRRIECLSDVVEALGADSATWYTWVHHCPAGGVEAIELEAGQPAGPLRFEILDSDRRTPTRPYAEWAARALRRMSGRGERLGVDFFPHISRGWDGTPRNYPGGIVVDNTPASFEAALRDVKLLAARLPTPPAAITINAWNEWVEGSYLEPDTATGLAYLEAIRRVFGPANRAETPD